MKWLFLVFRLIGKLLSVVLILAICIPILLVAFMGNQPMAVPQAPKGMTYWEFLSDRLEAAKVVQPSRCGWGMILSLAALGPIYSVVYTEVAIHPQGFLAKVTAPDPDIHKGVENASWFEVPGIWWRTVERLSWTMLAKTHPGCNFRPVASGNNS
jgi:hypothetical protein